MASHKFIIRTKVDLSSIIPWKQIPVKVYYSKNAGKNTFQTAACYIQAILSRGFCVTHYPLVILSGNKDICQQ